MPRKTPLLLTALLLAASSLSTAKGISPTPESDCKAVPGTEAWPSAASWARLNESTGGRLLQSSPPGAVCHPGQPTFNSTGCAAANSSWTAYEFHSSNPVSVDWNQWTNDTCLPWHGYPCSGKGYPVFVVNASTANHVKAGVDFARKNNIRLVVKSSGHDYIGRSVAPNSLSIWVHHLKGKPQPHTFFRPKNCNVQLDSTAVTVGAGTQMEELYSFLDTLNQTTIGGGGKTVSLGGYLTGGGHGLLSPTHGLAADQVLEMEIVTPTGRIVTANECTNQDLFFAMRGGGGSTFGILTSVTLQTFPTPPLTSRIVAVVTSDLNNPSTFPMMAYVLSQFPSLIDDGLSGYSFYFTAFPNPLSPDKPTLLAGMLLAVVLQNSTDAAMDALFAPILSHVNATWPDTFQTLQIPSSFPSFYAWYQVNFDTSPAGRNMAVGSRLLGRDHLTANLTRNAEILRQMASPSGGGGGGGGGTMHLVAGKGVRDAKPRGGGNAVCPAWRKAYVHISNGVEFSPLNATARTKAMRALNDSLQGVRELAPDMGAYMNEAHPEEPDWQREFWGDNYKKLLRIKRAVDPEDVLWCTPCVGNERWKEIDGQLCRV